MVVQANELLQADVTLIVGVLVLLTITQLFSGTGRVVNLRRGRFAYTVLVSVILLCISATFAIYEHVQLAAISLTLGLITLIIAIGLTVITIVRPRDDFNINIA